MKSLLFLFLISSCMSTQPSGTGQNSRPQNETQPVSATTVDQGAVATGVKPPLRGLICRGYDRIDVTGGSDDAMMKITNGVVVQLNWKDIQTRENGPIVRNNKLDEAIQWSRNFTKKYGVEMPIKLRLYCGINSPDWLMNKNYFTAKGEKIPKFWEPEYIQAFADVQAKLAAIYDDVPEVREVVDGGTGIISAESFIRPFSNAPARMKAAQMLLKEGYTKEKDANAIYQSFESMRPWKKTLVSVAFSPYQYLDKSGRSYETATGVFPFIDKFISIFGDRAVIGNNGLRTVEGRHGEDFEEGGERYALFNYFKKLHSNGVKVYFQTATTERGGGDLRATIEDGIKYGAIYIELPTRPREYAKLLDGNIESLKKKVLENYKARN